jgi:hypothetical protein
MLMLGAHSAAFYFTPYIAPTSASNRSRPRSIVIAASA